MQLDGGDNREGAAVRRQSNGGRRASSNGDGSLDFSSTVERILSTLEERGDDHDPHHGPLSQTELSRLSMLCTMQQQRSPLGRNKKEVDEAASADEDGKSNVLDENIGFADVDADMILELVEYLEKHVALASGINVVQSSFQEIQKIQAGGGCQTMEQVR